jgi:hypothetical protein
MAASMDAECGLLSDQAQQAARLNAHNATRGLLGKFRIFGMMLNVPLTMLRFIINGVVHFMPTYRITSIFEMLVTKHPQLLFGGYEHGSEAKLQNLSFWTYYQFYHPEHLVSLLVF